MRRLALLLPIVLVAGTGLRGDEPKSDLDKFQGTWTIIQQEANGQAAPAEGLKPFRLVFQADRYEVKVNDEVVETGTQTLDPKKSPKELDIKIKKGEGEGKTQLGIYEIDGDKIKLCVSLPGSEDRPKEFAGKEGKEMIFFVLKREAP